MLSFKKLSLAAYILSNLLSFYAIEPSVSSSVEVQTIHGTMIVTNPLIIELLESPAMQRLKKIRQYGITDYILQHTETFTRWDHSLGVFYLLHEQHVSLEEQIAGLLHDISHTAFSHGTDIFFMGNLTSGAYQDTIHEEFLIQFGIQEILEKYGLNVHDVSPKKAEFRALEQKSPALCADRIEYNLHSAYLDNLLSRDDIEKIHNDLKFDGQNWYFTSIECARQFALIPLHDILFLWNSPASIFAEIQLSAIIKRAFESGLITKEDILFNRTDDELWQRLKSSEDPEILIHIKHIENFLSCFEWRETNDPEALTLKPKFSGVDPLIKTENGFVPLTSLDPEFAEEFKHAKNLIMSGYHIAIPELNNTHSSVIPDPRHACALINTMHQRSTVQEA